MNKSVRECDARFCWKENQMEATCQDIKKKNKNKKLQINIKLFDYLI
jgi:hypothetical protein